MPAHNHSITWMMVLVAGAHHIATIVCMVVLAKYAMPLGEVGVVASSSYFHLALAVITYVVLRFVVVAPFGRHAALTNVRLTVPAPLSWALQECPTLMNVAYYLLIEFPCFTLGCSTGKWLHLVAHDPLELAIPVITRGLSTLHVGLLFFVIHYTHRALLYPLFVRNGTPVPIHVTLSATLYCLFNGRLQLLANIREGPSASLFPLESQWRMVLFGLGSAVFIIGMRLNVLSDYYLVSLKVRPPKHAYKMPRGGMFECVSCANFLGEIVEWFGYAVLVWSTTASTKPDAGLAAFSFTAYVVANLLPRGQAHHAWYRKTFGSAYDVLRRRAVIPFLY